LKLKHEFNVISFPRHAASQLALLPGMHKATGPFFQVAGAAEPVNVQEQYSSETKYVCSSPSIGTFFFLFGYVLNSQTLY